MCFFSEATNNFEIVSGIGQTTHCKTIKQDAKGYLVTAEAFGEGIHMWLRSQGEWVEVIK